MTKRKYEKPDVKVEPYTGWELIGGCTETFNVGSSSCDLVINCDYADLSV